MANQTRVVESALPVDMTTKESYLRIAFYRKTIESSIFIISKTAMLPLVRLKEFSLNFSSSLF